MSNAISAVSEALQPNLSSLVAEIPFKLVSTKKILSPLGIIHYSFCRDDKDLSDKINNFGHSVESKKDPFYDIQRSVNLNNYETMINFKTHGAGAQWPTLKFIREESMSKYMEEEARLIYEN